MFDGDPNGVVYKDYTTNTFVPNFSHHKLTCFEYADGVNNVNISDTFLTYSTDRTDLDMYYEKVGLAYGQASGRQISPDYPSAGIDIQPKIDEYRIVGPTGGSIEIDSISSSATTVTVNLQEAATGLEVDTPFRIEGISASGYNGQFVVSEKLSSTSITYQVQNAPSVSNPTSTGATLSLSSDTVTSASPYLFNISLRSVFGMCGVLADGAIRQLDLNPWLSHSSLVLDYKKMITLSLFITEILQQQVYMMIIPSQVMKPSVLTLEQDINPIIGTSM